MFEFIRVLTLFCLNLIITLPSILFHGTRNIYLKYTTNMYHDIKSLKLGVHTRKSPILLVLIHGRNGHYTNFNPLVRAIQSNITLRCGILRIDLGSNSGTSIFDEVEIVRHQLLPYMDSASQIILIGLSKGGLTAVQYQITYPDKVSKIITISSPLNGTKVATYHPTCSVTRNELGYNSPFIQQMKRQANPGIIHSIVPTCDHIIIPTSSAYLKGSTIYVYKGLASHAGVLHSPEVIYRILMWLD